MSKDLNYGTRDEKGNWKPFKIEIDKISHPLRVLPSGKISIFQAWTLAGIFSVLSTITVIYGAVLLNKLELEWKPLLFIWLIAFSLMVSYEVGPKTKKYGFWWKKCYFTNQQNL